MLAHVCVFVCACLCVVCTEACALSDMSCPHYNLKRVCIVYGLSTRGLCHMINKYHSSLDHGTRRMARKYVRLAASALPTLNSKSI